MHYLLQSLFILLRFKPDAVIGTGGFASLDYHQFLHHGYSSLKWTDNHAGFGFKMGLIPFHQWLPDTYEGAPAPITALLAAATKKAGFAATIRIVILGMVVLHLDWSLALGIIAVMTMTIGNVAAIMQKNISRMLAYSSIAQVGYILLGISIMSESGLTAAIIKTFNLLKFLNIFSRSLYK